MYRLHRFSYQFEAGLQKSAVQIHAHYSCRAWMLDPPCVHYMYIHRVPHYLPDLVIDDIDENRREVPPKLQLIVDVVAHTT